MVGWTELFMPKVIILIGQGCGPVGKRAQRSVAEVWSRREPLSFPWPQLRFQPMIIQATKAPSKRNVISVISVASKLSHQDSPSGAGKGLFSEPKTRRRVTKSGFHEQEEGDEEWLLGLPPHLCADPQL